jgi:hypothetical protein
MGAFFLCLPRGGCGENTQEGEVVTFSSTISVIRQDNQPDHAFDTAQSRYRATDTIPEKTDTYIFSRFVLAEDMCNALH